MSATAIQFLDGITAMPWGPSFFTLKSGEPIKTLADVIETMAESARVSGKAELWGVSATEPDGEVVICYTGNGPKSEAHAKMIANVCNNWPIALERIAELLAACKEAVNAIEFLDTLREGSETLNNLLRVIAKIEGRGRGKASNAAH